MSGSLIRQTGVTFSFASLTMIFQHVRQADDTAFAGTSGKSMFLLKQEKGYDKRLKLRHFLTTLETHLSRSEQALHDDVASHSRQAAVTGVWLATIGWLDTSGEAVRHFVCWNIRVVRHSRQAADTDVCRKPTKLPESNVCNKRGFDGWFFLKGYKRWMN